ncbi:acyl-CoA synthetase (AMP-forming)/AMP-acid ligase II [Streptomyces sp. V4I8]
MFRSEYADVPAVELPIHEAVLGRAAEFGDTPALIDGTDGTTLTYEQLDRFHRRIAAALAEAGVRKGDVLALHSPNTVHGGTARIKRLPWVRRGAPAVISGAPRRRAPRACVPGGCRAAYVAERVAPYKRVRQVTFIEGVPRAASGKILRRELRALREDT